MSNLRLTDDQNQYLLPATPSVISIKAVDQVLITSVTSRPLSLQEIQDRGININDSNFTAYEFTFGVATLSNQVPITFDMAFPSEGPPDTDGNLGLPVVAPGLNVPSFWATGFVFRAPNEADGIRIPPIPGVVIIPGNIAFLHQYFQVLVLTSNVAPAGSQLVVTSATATLELPLGANGDREFFHTPSDDPLWPAATTNPPAHDDLCDKDHPPADPRLCAALHRVEASPHPNSPLKRGHAHASTGSA